MADLKISQLSPLQVPARDDRVPIVDTSAAQTKYIEMMYMLTGATRIVAPAGYIGYADYYVDGVDDQSEINLAITDTNSLGGGSVVCVGGTFSTSGAIVAKQGVELKGFGKATLIKLANNANAHLITATSISNIRISNLKLDGNRANQTSNLVDGIRFITTINSIVDNVEIVSCREYGILFNTTSTGNNIVNNTISDCALNILINSNSDNTIISGNRALSAFTAHGISLSGSSNCIVNGNISRDNATNGILMTNLASNNIISSNYVLNSGAANGISVETNCNQNTVSCNRSEKSGQSGIIIWGQNCIVNGNICWNSGQTANNTYAGILVEQSATDCIVTGNRCGSDTSVTNRPAYGIAILPSADQITVSGNNVRGNLTKGIINTSSGGVRIENNIGCTTENSGLATIVSGTTSIIITHGLDLTPTLDDLSVVLGNNATNDPGSVWISSISSTQFTINCRNNPGVSGLNLGWRARII